MWRTRAAPGYATLLADDPRAVQVPGLAVVLVGNRKDSEAYVRSKKKGSVEVGFQSFGTELPEDATEEEVLKVRHISSGGGGGGHLLAAMGASRRWPPSGASPTASHSGGAQASWHALRVRWRAVGGHNRWPHHPLTAQVVEAYNADPSVHGILVQLPLPKHINETRVLDAISLEKDVDGFHPFNIGSLAMRGRKPKFVSCTPKARRAHGFLQCIGGSDPGGRRHRPPTTCTNPLRMPCPPNNVCAQGCIELLERSGVQIAGKRAVVVGRSNIVGLPAALLLQNRDATVTMVHSRTPNAHKICAGVRGVPGALHPSLLHGSCPVLHTPPASPRLLWHCRARPHRGGHCDCGVRSCRVRQRRLDQAGRRRHRRGHQRRAGRQQEVGVPPGGRRGV